MAQAAEKAEGEEEKLDAEGANTFKGVATSAVMLNAQPVADQPSLTTAGAARLRRLLQKN
jgi:hypothetical protein